LTHINTEQLSILTSILLVIEHTQFKYNTFFYKSHKINTQQIIIKFQQLQQYYVIDK